MSKILIVEDEKSLSEALKAKLEKEGFDVDVASNGALGLVLAKEKKPNLIILDILMPIMDGLTMLDELKKDEQVKGIPVLVLTNLSDDETMSKALQNNTFDFLVKSDWPLEAIVEKIKEKLA